MDQDDEDPAAATTTIHDNSNAETSSLLLVGRDSRREVERRGKIVMAVLYAVQVFYSFFIM